MNISRAGLLTIILIGVSQFTFSQKDTLAQRYAETIKASELKEHLDTLASDFYEGRETGMKGQKMAADYLVNYYKELGIEAVADSGYLQEFPLKRVSTTESTVSLAGEEFHFLEDFYFFGGFELDSLHAEEIVFAGYGISDSLYNDYQNREVKDKVVMIISGEPFDENDKSLITGTEDYSHWSDDFRIKRDAATENGAKALFIINQNFDQYVSRIKYFLESPRMQLDDGFQGEEVLPTFFVSPDMANRVLQEAKNATVESVSEQISKNKKPVGATIKIDLEVEIDKKTEQFSSENVLAFIEGSDEKLKDQVVIISAHYDHIGINDAGEINNGADDDGSGTVTALEIAEAFYSARADGNGPKRSVLILHVSGEEKGLLGSEFYADNPWFPLDSTVANLNIDMIGRVDEQHEDSNYVYIIGSDKLSTELHEINENANDLYTNLDLDYTYNDPGDPNRFYYRSDHYNFAKNGIPVIFYFSGVHEDYHRPGDTPDKIMHGKMETIAHLIFHTAWDLANREKRIEVDVESDFKN